MTAPTNLRDEGRWRVGLIHTKMTPPRLPRGRVLRHALLDRMEAAIARRLTVLVAPAGFGKTTLLAEWFETISARGHQTAWLSLDDDDDDPQQFGAYLIASLSRSAANGPGRAADLLREDPLMPMKTIQAVLLKEIAECGKEVFLFVDEFERLNSRPSFAIALRLLRYAPPNLHLILGSRRQPNLPLGALAADEQLVSLDSGALRFTADEAQTLFAQMDGIGLGRLDVEMLNDAAEGWVTGLQLAALALQESVDPAQVAHNLASNRFGIDSYLDSMVFSQLPREMLEFALRVSILDRMSASACDEIMGTRAHSWEKLDWLERHNIFTRALDVDRQWFRFHALMINALRRRAQQQLHKELPTLHRRASGWFASRDLWPEAVRHALASGETEQAAEWAENCAAFMIDRGDAPTLVGWLSKLPADLVKGSVRLRFANAWAQTLSFQIEDARRSIEALADELVAATDASGGSSKSAVDAVLHAEVTAVRAGIAGLSDDAPLALELAQQVTASDGLPPWVLHFVDSSKIFGLAHSGRFDQLRQLRKTLLDRDVSGSSYASQFSSGSLALASLMEGRLREATEISEFTLARAEAMIGRESAAAALPACCLAALYYESNDLLRARQLLIGRTAIVMDRCPLSVILPYCRTAARIYARQGDLASALVVLEEAREVATDRKWLRLRVGCDAETVRLLLNDGRIADAERLTADLLRLMPTQNPSPMGSFLETWVSWYEIQVRIALARERPGEVASHIQELRVQVSAVGMRYLEARLSILLALAFDRDGDTEGAFRELDTALNYAIVEPMISSFVDEGELLAALLRKRHRDTSGRDKEGQIERLLAMFTHGEFAPPPTSAQPAGATVLSAREMEIIDHVSHGLSNKEIARVLLVAPETIKWHLKNIYEKLNVSSRVEAVQASLGSRAIKA